MSDTFGLPYDAFDKIKSCMDIIDVFRSCCAERFKLDLDKCFVLFDSSMDVAMGNVNLDSQDEYNRIGLSLSFVIAVPNLLWNGNQHNEDYDAEDMNSNGDKVRIYCDVSHMVDNINCPKSDNFDFLHVGGDITFESKDRDKINSIHAIMCDLDNDYADFNSDLAVHIEHTLEREYDKSSYSKTYQRADEINRSFMTVQSRLHNWFNKISYYIEMDIEEDVANDLIREGRMDRLGGLLEERFHE